MNHYLGILTTIAFALIVSITGCSSTDTANPITSGTDEESTVQLTLDDEYNEIRNGAHLIMSYDAATNSFTGTVENTTSATLTRVRVEVHLSNGVELGPTTPIDLAPGEKTDVLLTATSTNFDMWTAHPEVGPSSGSGGEGAEGGEAGGEHGQGGHN